MQVDMRRSTLSCRTFPLGVVAAFSLIGTGGWPAVAHPQSVREFVVGHEIQGPIRRAAVDLQGAAWIATPHELYRIDGIRIGVAYRTAYEDREIALAPGSGRFAWITNGAGPNGLFGVEIVSLQERTATAFDLHAPGDLPGFSGVNFGNRGLPIVTISPLGNAEGLSGEFQYRFWTNNGIPLGAVRGTGPGMPIMDEQGAALLLLGNSSATAYAQDGTQLWTIPGRFRSGRLAAGGQVALLNPAREIDEVRVVHGGAVATARLPGAVYEMALMPDGRKAVVATSGGALSIMDLRSCRHASCRVKALPTLLPGADFNVTALRFINDDLIAAAIIEREGAPPDVQYRKGDVFVITGKGERRFHKALDIPQPPVRSPLLDVVFGSQEFAAYTSERAAFVSLRR